MKNSNIVNFLEKIRDDFAVTAFPVDGFDFIIDDAGSETEEVFEPLPGMPRVAGFLYEHDGRMYGEQPATVPETFDVDVVDDMLLPPGEEVIS